MEMFEGLKVPTGKTFNDRATYEEACSTAGCGFLTNYDFEACKVRDCSQCIFSWENRYLRARYFRALHLRDAYRPQEGHFVELTCGESYVIGFVTKADKCSGTVLQVSGYNVTSKKFVTYEHLDRCTFLRAYAPDKCRDACRDLIQSMCVIYSADEDGEVDVEKLRKRLKEHFDNILVYEMEEPEEVNMSVQQLEETLKEHGIFKANQVLKVVKG